MNEVEQIKKGFNQGYTLQKLNPDLATHVADGFKDLSQPFAQGFIAGSIECIKELKRDVSTYLKKIDKHERSKIIDSSRDVER